MSEALLARRDRIAIVRFNRPDALNAMNRAMAEAYAATLRELDNDPDVRAVVVTGQGRGFCSGADLALLGDGPANIWDNIIPADTADLPGFVRHLSIPAIAAVNAPVAGVGFAYLMGSDVRFLADDATIATSFARLGLVAEYGLSWLRPRVIGLGRSLDVLLTGRALSASDARSLGLVEYVVPSEHLLDAAVAYATDLAENCSPFSVASIKAQIYTDLARDEHTALHDTLARMDASFRYGDLDVALAARDDHRRPNFGPDDRDSVAREETPPRHQKVFRACTGADQRPVTECEIPTRTAFDIE